MGFIRRVVFVVGFFPMSIIFFFRWIITGKSALRALERFEDWVDGHY